MNVNIYGKIPIKIWTDYVEEGAMEQAINLANLPFAFKHIALMPDVHQGYGMPIGGVMATRDVIIPNAVGVDIGCGMCAVKTSLGEIATDTLKKIMGEIREVVPVGFKHQSEKQDKKLMPFTGEIIPIVTKEFNNALSSIGTLGGGNHFIEIQKGSDNHIWIMIHSGSRNLGKKVADYYNKIAKELNQKWFSDVDSKWDLAFLPIGTREADLYIWEMQYCVEYAFANRKLMIDRIKDIFESETSCGFDPIINIAHNYARLEHHFNTNVWVHRKGATSARLGEIGIIPGSQGTSSFITKGLGNPLSFNSCSHGAGRKMGRKQAINTLDIKKEQEQMRGIVHSIRNNTDLDEAPGAYKDIEEVMNNQKDLTEIVVELKPLGVIKG